MGSTGVWEFVRNPDSRASPTPLTRTLLPNQIPDGPLLVGEVRLRAPSPLCISFRALGKQRIFTARLTAAWDRKDDSLSPCAQAGAAFSNLVILPLADEGLAPGRGRDGLRIVSLFSFFNQK